MTTIWLVFWAAVLSDLATGLGVLPVVALRGDDPKWQGITAAAAGGMMLSASTFALAEKAFNRGAAVDVLAGMAAGALFVGFCAGAIARRRWHISGVSEAGSRRSVLMVAMLFVHSIPEGVAIGVGYATGELNFGLLLAVVIAVHNIPEGLSLIHI